MDKCREQFEEWAGKQRFNTERLNDCNSDECKWYANAATDMLWDAWQASRQALVVELPTIQMPTNDSDFSEGCHTGRLTYQDAVIDVLQEIGIKWKL